MVKKYKKASMSKEKYISSINKYGLEKRDLVNFGAKYDFKLLNDKLVVSPEGNVTATFTDIYAGLCNPSLVLTPKVSVEYKPVDALKVSGSVEVPVNFGMKGLKEFGYLNTGIKGALNMRYEWK